MESIIKAIEESESLEDVLASLGSIDVNNTGKKSEEIPLHVAAIKGNKEALQILLSNGADINIKNDEEKTAVMVLIDTLGKQKSEYEFIDMIKILIEKNAEVPDTAVSIAIKRCFDETAKLLIRKDSTRAWKIDKTDGHYMEFIGKLFCYGTEEEDIMTYILTNNQFTLLNKGDGSGCGYPGMSLATYKLIKSFMEKQDWNNALKLAVILKKVVTDWNSFAYDDDDVFRNQYGDNDDNKKDIIRPGVFEKILENITVTDLSFVDSTGYKLVDLMFDRYLADIVLVDVSVGKKLLEHGANKELPDKELSEWLDRVSENASMNASRRFDVHLQQLVDTGADLNAKYVDEKCIIWGEEYDTTEVKIMDKLYLTCAELGYHELLEKVLNAGADIFTYFDNHYKYNGIEASDGHDKCTEIIAREIASRGLLEKKFTRSKGHIDKNKYVPTQISVLEYLKQKGKLDILEKIGFVPKAPVNLQVKHEGLSCTISWENNGQSEDLPVTGYLIEFCAQPKNENKAKAIKDILKNNPAMARLWELDPDTEYELDMVLAGLFQSQALSKSLIRNCGEISYVFQNYPETENQIENILNSGNNDWKTAAILSCSDKTTHSLFDLKFGTKIKFRVSAGSKNGFSLPTTEPEYQLVKVLPGPPGSLMVKIVNQGKDLDVTWTEPEQGKFATLTMYRVEGKCVTGEWREVGRISVDFGKRLIVLDYKKMNIQSIRVISINNDGESVPSSPCESFE